ncbi:MAG: DsbA family protein [Alphaproteobacteria bacterium]|nr:DsbA family protein [Alphaproteobacteria bacterium]
MAETTRISRQLIGWSAAVLLFIGAGVTWYVLDPGFQSTRAQSDIVAGGPDDEFGQRVRDYLLANPEVIVEALQTLEVRRQQAEESEAQSLLNSRADDVFHDPESPVGGNPDGDVTMVEFFDYNCPYCRQVAPIMIDAEADDPELRIVYKEFPILGPGSIFAAKAALAAARQGRYVEFHKAMMNASGRVDEALTLSIAEEAGLDIERLKLDIQDPAVQAEIDGNIELAQALRINGTPAFVIGDEILRGATDLETMTRLIEGARRDGKATGSTAKDTAD